MVLTVYTDYLRCVSWNPLDVFDVDRSSDDVKKTGTDYLHYSDVIRNRYLNQDLSL